MLIAQGWIDVLMGLNLLFLFYSTYPIPHYAIRETFPGKVQGVLFVMAHLLPLAGALKLIAGRRNRQCRSRGLGFVALFSCLLSVFPWPCPPLALWALGVFVYGLVVYASSEAAHAFQGPSH